MMGAPTSGGLVPDVELGRVPSDAAVREMDEQERARCHSHSLGAVELPMTVSWIVREFRVDIYLNKWWMPISWRTGDRVILRNLVGEAKPGQLIAIMGPSGCGKSTLLNVLARRTFGGLLDGSVFVNGQPFTHDMNKHISFVMQEDVLFSNLTVRETLTFAALLRLKRDIPREAKLDMVTKVIELLDLQKCVDTRIGSQFERGVSGGERKRVSIGVELLGNPSIIFLDEPTSGLDANLALSLAQTLKRLANCEGRTIICSIHQPSSPIFRTFDRLYLLHDGRLVYDGRIGGVAQQFAQAGAPSPPDYNIADHILEVVAQKQRVRDRLVASVEQSNSYRRRWARLEAQEKETANAFVVERLPFLKRAFYKWKHRKERGLRWEASWWQQYRLLTERGFRQQFQLYFAPLNLFQMFAIAIIAGLLWLQTPNIEAAINDHFGLIFFVSVFWSFTPLLASVTAYPVERGVTWKERMAFMYRASSYFLAKTTVEMLMASVLPFIFICIVYWMAGLRATAIAFGIFIGIVILTGWVYQALAIVIGALVPQFQRAVVLASTLALTFLLLGGFYILVFPSWLRWTPFVSPTFYSFNILAVSQFTSDELYTCRPSGSTFPSCQAGAAFITGTEILRARGLTMIAGVYVVYLICFLIGFRLVGYLMILFFGR